MLKSKSKSKSKSLFLSPFFSFGRRMLRSISVAAGWCRNERAGALRRGALRYLENPFERFMVLVSVLRMESCNVCVCVCMYGPFRLCLWMSGMLGGWCLMSGRGMGKVGGCRLFGARCSLFAIHCLLLIAHYSSSLPIHHSHPSTPSRQDEGDARARGVDIISLSCVEK